jgi:hypothetical protein
VLRGSSPTASAPAPDDRGTGGRISGALDLTARCEHCNKPLPEGSRSDRKYCSLKCTYRAANALDAAARREARAGRPCAHCGSIISADFPARTKYCSRQCQWQVSHARWKASAIHQKTCPNCKAEFRTRIKRQVHCSPPCARAQERELRSALRRAEWASGARDHLRGRLNATAFDRLFS